MKKEIFIAVCDRLKEVPALRWIDAEEGQLNQAERPPLSFPAALVDMSYADCETLAGGRQKISVSIQIRVVFTAVGATNTKAPQSVRDNALRSLDTLESIHKVLQLWGADRLFMPMRRKRVSVEKRSDGLKVYTMLYQMEYLDC